MDAVLGGIPVVAERIALLPAGAITIAETTGTTAITAAVIQPALLLAMKPASGTASGQAITITA